MESIVGFFDSIKGQDFWLIVVEGHVRIKGHALALGSYLRGREYLSYF